MGPAGPVRIVDGAGHERTGMGRTVVVVIAHASHDVVSGGGPGSRSPTIADLCRERTYVFQTDYASSILVARSLEVSLESPSSLGRVFLLGPRVSQETAARASTRRPSPRAERGIRVRPSWPYAFANCVLRASYTLESATCVLARHTRGAGQKRVVVLENDRTHEAFQQVAEHQTRR